MIMFTQNDRCYCILNFKNIHFEMWYLKRHCFWNNTLAIVYFCTFISKKKDETVPCFFAKYPILKSTIFQPRVFNIKVTIASGYWVLSFFQISLQYSSSITILQKQKSREYSAYILIQHTTCNRPLNVPRVHDALQNFQPND